MGHDRLEQVLTLLRQAGFSAEAAYPGQSIPLLTKAVAAAYIHKVDSAALTVTVGVTVLCPARLGGSTCEVEALRATDALCAAGAMCVQSGCTFDRASQNYAVEILASFSEAGTGSTAESPAYFSVYMDGIQQTCAVAFREEEKSGCQAEYITGESLPRAISAGSRLWTIRLEEQFPLGTAEPAEPEDSFTLVVKTAGKTETYSGCRWTAITREFSQSGLHRVRTGIALRREEVSNG